MLAFHHFLEAADRIGQRNILALDAGELLGDVERLRQEFLNLAGARHGLLVVVGKFVDAQNRDDVLQILVALQDLLHLLRDVVVLFANECADRECGSWKPADRRPGKCPAPPGCA